MGERPIHVFAILEGWAMRYKMLRDGRRQIVAFLIPGDLCDPFCFLLHRQDHSIGAMTELHIGEITRDVMEEMVISRPDIAKAMWVSALVAASIQREWCVNIGKRIAFERLSHLLCELFHRLSHVGLVSGNQCALPITQYDLADATGLTAIHVNRTLQELRRLGLIELRRRQLIIPDLDRLQQVAEFDPAYLHPSPNEQPMMALRT
jgi:CRP-like cAMP-binding protein